MALRHARQHGFTLIELLVTMAILAVLAALTWRGIDGMAGAQTRNLERSVKLSKLQMGMLQWRADLDAIISSANSITPATPNSGDLPRALDWSGAALRLTRIDAAEPDNALRVVAWSLRNMAGQDHWCRWQSDLIRTQSQWQTAWRQSHGWLQKSTPAANVAGSAINATNASACISVSVVQGWQVYFYRGDSWSNAASSAEAGHLLPDGIRLSIELDKGHPLGGTLTQDWVRPTISGNKS